MVTAELPGFAKPGQKIDITVSAIGKASNLRGGTLLLSSLRGVDGEIYALAQGALTATGIDAAAAGSKVNIGVPTAARIPSGATVERVVDNPFDKADRIVLNVRESDFTTTNAIVSAINGRFGNDVARALDGVSITLQAPQDLTQRVAFMSMIENMDVMPGEPPARVVINAKTGTVVISRNVRVTAAAVTHGTQLLDLLPLVGCLDPAEPRLTPADGGARSLAGVVLALCQLVPDHLARPLTDVPAVHLCRGEEDVQRELTHRGRCVEPEIQGDEVYAPVLECFDTVGPIDQRTERPVEFADHDVVPLLG
jgi:hypothetical protein